MAFWRRLVDATCNIQKPHHSIRMSKSMREDIKVWLTFLSEYNGVNVITQTRSSLYANTQLRAHRCAEKKIKSKKNMEDRLPEPITLQTRQNSIGKFLCTMRL